MEIVCKGVQRGLGPPAGLSAPGINRGRGRIPEHTHDGGMVGAGPGGQETGEGAAGGWRVERELGSDVTTGRVESPVGGLTGSE